MTTTPHTFTVTVGYTETDRANNYVPSQDGYRDGARQHCEQFTVEWTNSPWSVPIDRETLEAIGGDVETVLESQARRTAETLAEAVFYATNAPRFMRPEGLTGQVCEAIERAHADIVSHAHRIDLRPGDTIRVDGGQFFDTVLVECKRVGWEVRA